MIELIRKRVNAARAARAHEPVDGGVVADMDGYRDAKVVITFFDAGGAAVAVVKVARDSNADVALAHEYRILTTLRGALSPPLLDQIPEPLFLEQLGGRSCLGVGVVDGDPMMVGYRDPSHTADESSVRADLEVAATWLDAFQQETHRGFFPMNGTTLASFAEPILRAYEAVIGIDDTVAALFREVRARAQELFGLPIPVTAVHGDYRPGNLLVREDVVTGVVDWERGRVSGSPLWDVYRFSMSYGFSLKRAATAGTPEIPGHAERARFEHPWARYGASANAVGFAYTFFSQSRLPRLVRASIDTHLEALGLPPEANAVFFPLFLAEQAAALTDPGSRDGIRQILHGLWRDREAAWLFVREPRPTSGVLAGQRSRAASACAVPSHFGTRRTR